ncbi:hypothetical protein WSK_1817 [Novosphingobium sp. Rr 2-17]|uniref:nuclear transport factor 2 family protein n=1 Tax=Novosphingobium sp. Rr 2-17 TaxID=555793 RepID=UPI000269AB34|nr:hypothetical protein [Novosphingobium sp. Rr 2-17]EIZ79584.1 hypothetical protein WSK_1817 [Novosphingobium sp. Rr 2-17]
MDRIDAKKIAVALSVGLVLSSPAKAATNTPREIDNKQLVVDFYQALDAANSAGTTAKQARSIAERFLSRDYVQHQEGASSNGNAREAFVRNAEAVPPGPPPPAMRTPARTIALMAEGDRVIIIASRDVPDVGGGTRPVFIFNMFRIEGGKLAEHWDALPSAMTKPPSDGTGQQ